MILDPQKYHLFWFLGHPKVKYDIKLIMPLLITLLALLRLCWWSLVGMKSLRHEKNKADISFQSSIFRTKSLNPLLTSFTVVIFFHGPVQVIGLTEFYLAICGNQCCGHEWILLAPSGALIAIPTYYWPSTNHFFRSHRSSTLDLHFLSHYSYINHWTHLLATCTPYVQDSAR